MNWWPSNCRYGDMIRVQVGSIWHYGIYLSDDEVIQFGEPPRRILQPNQEIRVISTSVDTFSGGETVEVAKLSVWEKVRRHSRRKTAKLARSRLGEGGYDLLYNNCEHFAMDCMWGRSEAVQSQNALSSRRVEVWISRIPEEEQRPYISPPIREKEILAASNSILRKQRLWDWATLTALIGHVYGMSMSELSFQKSASGRWICPGLYVSLAHSGAWIAVSACDEPVGVDIEELPAKAWMDWEKLRPIMLTRSEIDTYHSLDGEDMLAIWTRKESLYKRNGIGVFNPRHTTAHVPCIRTYKTDGWCMSVTTRTGRPARIRIWDGKRPHDVKIREWRIP